MGHSKAADGFYHISGKKYELLTGSRAQVWHGTSYKTSGGLTKNNLFKNKHDRIVSKKKHSTATRDKRLLKHGYGTKKGVFGFVKLFTKSRSKKNSKRGHNCVLNHFFFSFSISVS